MTKIHVAPACVERCRMLCSRLSDQLRVLCAFAAITVGVSGCGASAARDGLMAPTTTVQSSPEILGATDGQRALLEDIFTGFPDLSLVEVRLGTAPGCPTDCADPEQPDGDWVYLALRAADSATATEAGWQALLVAGAFRDEGRAQGIANVVGKSVKIVFPDGRTEDLGEVVISQPFTHPIQKLSREELTARIMAGAAKAGLIVDAIEFAEPLHLAPKVVVTVAGASEAAVGGSEIVGSIQGDLTSYENPLSEGVYVEIRTFSGDVLAASGYSTRTGEGLGWHSPKLTDVATSGMVPGPVGG